MQQMTESRMAVSSVDKVLANHIYEYKKGVRRMILFTCNRRFEQQACHRLCRQSIDYVELTPEEDFILGAMLGYDICAQCERYCERKGKCKKCQHTQ